MVHFGYYEVPTMQGLQLVRWATMLPLELTLNVIEINSNQRNLNKNLKILGLLFAFKLNPLCGQH